MVACAPDGRVFVAEDPMDISLPKADAAEGRILCLRPDGRLTVFAEKLHAVFGLQYLEGKLYVLHNPQFSVFEDHDGVGRHRRELIEQTLPEPSALNWNDHVPANFRLAMDGYFYVASGDKGLHGAIGTDGSGADLFTGGLVRLRPDGSGLEVVCDGVRNILDVAINAEDEMFTYDNTDEHDWMGRFTQMVEAGFYGYPHDFMPQRPYTLWMMEDYGAGAACGVFANTEDALPAEFQDNVFLSDFGKRQILRVRVERAGGTYRAVSREDLFPNPPGDFRPVGITPGPDGKSLYICDWQHRDEKAKVSVGRLLKLTWMGEDRSTPKPAWYLPAALGAPFTATSAELVRALSHPSRQVRLTTQRRLADPGRFPPATVAKELNTLLHDASAPSLARIHALWALASLAEGRHAGNDILALSNDPDPIVRRQALRQWGTQRISDAVPALCARLKDHDASVRFQAATALGRIRDPKAIPALLNALEEADLFPRFAVFTALHRIGTNHPAAWPAILRGLESESARIREGTVFAVRETYEPGLVKALVDVFNHTTRPMGQRLAVLQLIATLPYQPPPWKGEWWAYHPALKPPPAKTESWSATALVLQTLRQGLLESAPELRRACIDGLALARDTNAASAFREIFPRETDPSSRATILRALGSLKDAGALPLVVAELKPRRNPESMAAAIAAAEAIGGADAIRILIDLLNAPGLGPIPIAQTVSSLGKLRATAATTAIRPLTSHADASVRAASFSALGRLQREAALPDLDAGLTDPSVEVRREVVKALGDLKSTNAVPALLKAYADVALRDEVFPALTRTPDARALEVLLDGISSKNPARRNAAHLALRDLSGQILGALEARAAGLSPQALTELRQIYAGHKNAEAGPLFARRIEQHTLEEYGDAALNLSGNAARGRVLFAASRGLNCLGCHRVAREGSELGPDLSGVGAQFDRRALAEAILYPSKAVREGYQQITIELADGEEFSGLVKGESADLLTLHDSAGREHKLPRASIKSRRNSALSLMPEGLQAALSLEEFADVVAYLSSLKGQAAGK